jgi:phytoene dehydrogenase-like protein
MKQVIVIGGGIAGLTAGIYARRSGFEVTILEQHNIPGGNSTSWRRGGYLFEGGMHWLTGSLKTTPLYRLWKETGALTDDTAVSCRDPFLTAELEGRQFCLYRQAEKLRDHLLEASPEDRRAIHALYRDIKKFKGMTVPVMDIKGLEVRQKSVMSPSLLLGMLPAIPRMGALGKITVAEYTSRFRHPGIRLLLENVVGTTEFSAMSLIFTLGCFASGDGGYPKGGSLTMANNMAKCFESLGGKIRYGCRAEKIQTGAGGAEGVQTAGGYMPADAVIAASDTLIAIDKLFDRPLNESWIDALRENTKPLLCTFVSLGVEADLSDVPENLLFPLKRPINFAGMNITSLGFNNYANYENYAPPGCTALTIILIGDSYDYWKACKESGEYPRKKEELADLIVNRLCEQLPRLRDKIAVRDVATPLTYERYCGTWKGSWMAIAGKNTPMAPYPCKAAAIPNLYFAGQRIQMPGGLPTALVTGRQAAQYLCRDAGTVFEGGC